MSSTKTVADVVVDQLAAWGVEYVFGVNGDAILYFLDSLGADGRIRFIDTRREDAAAFMASAYTKVTGRLAVCTGTSGPGAVNLLNGVADAAQDRVPLLAITGQVGLKSIGTNHKQYIDQQSLYRPLASYSALLAEPSAASAVLNRAMRAAVGARGVAHISIPKDVWKAQAGCEAWPPPPSVDHPRTIREEEIKTLVGHLQGARKPVILIGRGTRNVGPRLMDLAERWGAGIIHTLPATGVVPADHPLYLGGLGFAGKDPANNAIAQADLCLVIGASWWPEEYVPGTISRVQVDIDPHNLGANAPIAYGLAGDAAEILPRLTDSLSAEPNAEWLANLKTQRDHWAMVQEREQNAKAWPVMPQYLMRVLERTIADDALITLDSGDHVIWFARSFNARRQDVLVGGKWRSMGFGLPAALAARLAVPDRQVVAITGDGGLTMQLGELLTALKHRLAVTVLVVNNQSLALEENRQVVANLRTVGVHLNNPDFATFAGNCGGRGIRVESTAQLEPALRDALQWKDGLCLVDIPTARVIAPGTKP